MMMLYIAIPKIQLSFRHPDPNTNELSFCLPDPEGDDKKLNKKEASNQIPE